MADPHDQKKVLALCDSALDLSADARSAFLDESCIDQPAMRAAVESLLLAVSEAGQFLKVNDAAATAPISLLGKTVGSFTVLEKLGEGGMGSVYLAERKESGFTQTVAIKLLQNHLLGRGLVERFNVERRILAGLHHPYIAGLIDGGTTEQGVPYLVMEYVEGAPIDEYCDQQGLNLNERLSLIRKVAVAVEAAHQNLVVHRDLKPSNVLVTADGIPKLLDFGIAKLLDYGTDQNPGNTTVFGVLALTPDYASPEQVLEGKVTTASDVYSLGVLTYQLLTGERPYHIDTNSHREMLRAVETLRVTRPSARVHENAEVLQIARERATTPARLIKMLSGDLDTILMKALHKDPARRYQSVAAFSEDIQHYQSGLPVEARGDSLAYRVGRFVSRHRLGVATAAGTLALLLAALGVTGWAYFQAEAARADADERYRQVRAIAKTLMFEVFDDISRVPGTVSARETLATTAQEYLETLAATPESPQDVQLEAAQGYARLADIFGRQAVSGKGDRERSQVASEKAFALLGDLRRTHPEPAKVYRALAGLYSKSGFDTLYIKNRAVEARPQFELAFAAFEKAKALEPGNLDLLTEQLEARRRFADSFKWENDYTQAEELLVELLAEIVALRDHQAAFLPLLKMQGDVNQLLGEVRYFDGQTDAAISNYQQSLAQYREHVTIGGEDLRIANAMLIAHWSLGNTQVAAGAYDDAVANHDAALRLVELQFARDPGDANAARRRAIIQAAKAEALSKLGRTQEALDLMLAGNRWFEQQALDDPDTPGTQRSVAVNYQMTADVLAEGGDAKQACKWWRRTLDKWLEIDARLGISEFDAQETGKLEALLSDCQAL